MRKVFALTLAAAMVAGTLMGCGAGAPAPAVDAAAPAEATEEAAPAEATDEAAPAEATAEASGDFDWKKFDGEEITVLFSEHTYADAVEEKLGEFTEKTGIKVN